MESKEDKTRDESGMLSCDDSQEVRLVSSYRCFSFAIVYNEDGKRLAIGSSIHKSCAERNALWKVNDIMCKKHIVVCRIRKNRNDKKASFGISKPCQQCIVAMQLYNVEKVSYSVDKDIFSQWTDVNELKTAYNTQCDTIVRL
jgi:hypothetical protein